MTFVLQQMVVLNKPHKMCFIKTFLAVLVTSTHPPTHQPRKVCHSFLPFAFLLSKASPFGKHALKNFYKILDGNFKHATPQGFLFGLVLNFWLKLKLKYLQPQR
jgi:hypothetical protein